MLTARLRSQLLIAIFIFLSLLIIKVAIDRSHSNKKADPMVDIRSGLVPRDSIAASRPAVVVARENFASALTEQYKKTPWDVSASSDYELDSLVLDCSDDSHPEETCLFLYKQFPDEKVRRELKAIGFRHIVFKMGYFKKEWQKDL